MKIVTIVGARPQFVKAAVLSREFSNHTDIQEVIVHTGQHFDKNMSDVFFEEMQIPKPTHNLSIHGMTHGAMTGRMMEGIENIIIKEQPDAVMVYGDTNSTLAGALAAKKLNVKLIHVEAGLRSFNMEMPEEINRIVTDRIADLLLCPTETAVQNLKKEGFDHFDCKVIRCGDVMQDAAIYYAKVSENKSTIAKELQEKNYALCTIHRAENTDQPARLEQIIKALNHIHDNLIPVVTPLHPRTKNILDKAGISPLFTVIEPVGYFDMIELLKKSSLVLTDSGGVQKEAFFFGKNCVTLRDQTEWVELITHGFNMLSGANSENIVAATQTMLKKKNDFSIDLYGKGKAGEFICSEIRKSLVK